MTVHLHHILFVYIAATALFCAVALGCSNRMVVEEPTASLVTPAQAVDLSRTAMQDLNNFSFELTHPQGFTTLAGSLEMTKAGGIVTSNGFDLNAEAKIGRAFVRVEAIVINDKTWMTNPLTGMWSQVAPEDSPFSFLDPVKLVADILGETQHARYEENEQMSNELIVGEVQREAMPDVSLTLDAQSYLLKKIVITGIAQPEDESNTIRVITLSNFNAKVSLQPPS